MGLPSSSALLPSAPAAAEQRRRVSSPLLSPLLLLLSTLLLLCPAPCTHHSPHLPRPLPLLTRPLVSQDPRTLVTTTVWRRQLASRLQGGGKAKARAQGALSLVQRRGAQLVKDGKPFYFNGFNAYWLMYIASVSDQRHYVSKVLEQAKNMGLTVCRTWGFYDGSGWHALQTQPDVYNEDTFRALDYVVATAGSKGIHLLITFTNNWGDFGGKPQYWNWARAAGSYIPNEDGFYSDWRCRKYYKNFIKALLLRCNTLTGVLYRDDPTIFAWELVNEPRLNSDPSGNILQAWIVEMAAYVKSLDPKHLVSVGGEGFFGPSTPSLQYYNAEPWMATVGTDFVRNNQAPGIDIASIHAYSDSRYSVSSWSDKLSYYQEWLKAHLKSCQYTLGMPLLVGEFGPSAATDPYGSISYRNQVYKTTYTGMLSSAKAGHAGAVALLWELLPSGLASWDDGKAVFTDSQASSSTRDIIYSQSTALL